MGLSGPPKDRIVVEFIKGQLFRVIHVDGAIGGPTPSGNIHLAVFSERPAIPRRMVTHLEGGQIGEPIQGETVVREGMIREMDFDMVMSISAADEIAKLLTRIVREMNSAMTKKKSEEKS